MKEFADKLIGRLEEYKYSHLVERDKERLEHCTENERAEHCEGIDCFWCVWDRAISIVNELAEKYNGDWIPLSERLPEKNGRYITTIEWGKDLWGRDGIDVFDLWYMDGIWLVDEEDVEFEGEVIAWQPLPTPFRKEGEQ